MRQFFLLCFCLLAWLLPCAASSPALVNGIRQEYKGKMELWTLSLQAATTSEAQEKIWRERPDAVAYAHKMWIAIKGSLDQDWTLESGGWLLKLVCSMPTDTMAAEVKVFRTEVIKSTVDSVAKTHVGSANLAPICMGLLAIGDSSALKLLEKIEMENADRKVQGVAALAVAILLEALSDDPGTMKRRLTLIRKAIIESADVEIDGVTVAKLAEDQLYVIRYLSKGRVAPDLEGTDVTGAKIKLSDFSGKVIVLLFWNTAVNDCERILEIHRHMVKKMAGKPFVLLGVTNDSVGSIRALLADESVTWKNFRDTDNKLAMQYRILGRPVTFVLDKERKIQYVGNPGSFAELTADALVLDAP
jgi:peroxiredoxin